MPISNQINSIIVLSTNANFTAHTYTQVYAGANATPTINGVAVTMNAGSSLYINVRSISSTANVYVLGEPINVMTPGNYALGSGVILG
jgi:hypothetical protein